MKTGLIIVVLVAAVITAATFYFQSQSPSVSQSIELMSPVSWSRASSSAIWKLTEQSTELSDDDFDIFYDAVVEVLQKHGTFSDGGIGPGDFSSSRYVDQCTCMGVVAKTKITGDALALDVAQALKQFKDVHYVVIDGPHGLWCITSDGKFLKAAD